MNQPTLGLGIEEKEDGQRVKVLLPLPLAGPLDYRLRDGEPVPVPGTFVEVPLSGRIANGVVWDGPTVKLGKIVAFKKLKPIASTLDVPPMGEDLRRFVDWVSAYTLANQGAVLRMCLSSPAALKPVPTARHFIGKDAVPDGVRLTPARENILAVLADGEPRTASEIAELAAVSTSVVRGFEKAGAIEALELSVDLPFKAPNLSVAGPVLSDEQTVAAGAIRDKVWEGGCAPSLVDGVKGSG